MPSPKYHISVCFDVNKKLNFKYKNDELLVGSILPDETFSEHHLSHFQNGLNSTLPNLDDFEKDDELKKAIKSESVLAGYKMHLLADGFFNEYFKNKFKTFDEEDLKKKKHSDTFKYEGYLVLSKKLAKIKLDEYLLNEIEDTEKIKFNKEALRDMINSYNKDLSQNAFTKWIKKIFCFMHFELVSKEEMDKLYDNLIDYVYKNI